MTEPDLLALGRGSGNSCPVYSWLPSYSLCRLHKPGWEGCRAAEAKVTLWPQSKGEE